jgi:hypothetical protein
MHPRILFTILILLFAGEARPQLLLEDFEYPAGDTLARHTWSAHSGAGTNAILITPGSLLSPGYRPQPRGNSVTLGGAGGEDCNRGFTAVTAGDLYCILLISVSSAKTGGDYFFHLQEGPGAGSAFLDKVWVRDNGTGEVQFGLTLRASSGATYAAGSYGYNTTHLLVVKHTFLPGAANDQVRLWIDPDLTRTEGPPTLTVSEPTSADPPSLSLVSLRQGGATTSPALRVDAIAISTLWGEPPAPVALALFEARRITPDRVRLDWTTLSERNNYGFFVEKSEGRDSGYAACSGIIPGAGSSTERHDYTCTDSAAPTGRFYRLRQVDMDGTVRLSEPVEPTLTSATTLEPNIAVVTLSGHPNPFNPVTSIEFSLPFSGEIDLSIYDILGRRVETLVHGAREAGTHRMAWNGEGHASGVYVAGLRTQRGAVCARLMLMK